MLPSLNRGQVLFACRLFLCGFFMTSSLSGCTFFEPEDGSAAIVVGSTRISIHQLKKDMEYFSSDLGFFLEGDEQGRDQLIERIIDHYLILEYGKTENITLSDPSFESALREIKEDFPENTFQEALLRGYVDYEQWKRRLREMLLVDKIVKRVTEGVPPPNYQEIKRYFDANQDEFKSPRMVRFKQIVVGSREEAQSLLERIHKGEELEVLARECSIGPESDQGGEVGWVAEGQLDETMEEGLFSLPEGGVSPVTKTPYGYHIFKVLSIRPEGTRDLPKVMHEIEDHLYRQEQEIYCRDWLRGLKEKVPVSVNQDLIKSLELS
jgi:peptidyl-prolyl cis-trans isomerase C